MLKLIDLSKSYDSKKVIDNLTLEFPCTGFVAICGPSGCGKTTLLNLIAQLTKPDNGKIVFDIPKPRISMSFQEPRLLGGRTAAENVNLVLGDKKATLPQAEELLYELGISDTDLYPNELSGGMKARVSIARALAVKADLYLFDEPFANLDAETALLCAEVIKRKTEASLTVAVIHDTSLAERIADKVIFLK
jgi:ABC-type nitrate/sulfonate/bicarbonate transport system ATPase subunit